MRRRKVSGVIGLSAGREVGVRTNIIEELN